MEATWKIKVLIADDHDMVRLGLKIFLEVDDSLIVVGEAADGQQAIELCEALQPDVVLMDVKMPILDGLAATAIIKQKHPEVVIVILTSSFSAQMQEQAYQVGAQAVLQKGDRSDQLRKTILLAAH
jgi:two-component system, NarL family, response regulator LiaR